MDLARDGAAMRRQASQENILFRLREMFGEDQVQLFSGDRFRVADETSRIVAFPRTVEELCEVMRFAHEEGWRVIPAGAGTWLEMGNRPIQLDLIVSTEKLDRLLEYEPADLTASVEAGCTLAAFNKLATEDRQFIPLDPFGNDAMTIGGVIATASSGPMRFAYGTPRDWLVGIGVVHADGHITKAGGKVVKNVAGYDLCKLYTGSYGTLAIVAEMSFKLRALPLSEKTLLFYSDSAEALCQIAGRILDSDLMPTAMELLSPGEAQLIEQNQFVLALRFLNETETVDWQIWGTRKLGAMLKHTVLSDAEASVFWQKYHASEISPQW